MATNSAQGQVEEWYETAGKIVPTEAWYGFGLGAAFAGLALWLAGERQWSSFVAQLAPVFLLLALYHRRSV